MSTSPLSYFLLTSEEYSDENAVCPACIIRSVIQRLLNSPQIHANKLAEDDDDDDAVEIRRSGLVVNGGADKKDTAVWSDPRSFPETEGFKS